MHTRVAYSLTPNALLGIVGIWSYIYNKGKTMTPHIDVSTKLYNQHTYYKFTYISILINVFNV